MAVASDALVERSYNAGASVTAGQSVYLSAAPAWLPAQCDGTALEAGSSKAGIALHASLAGQPLAVQVSGQITAGATLAVGTEYVISAAAGAICPRADLATGNKYTRLGYAVSTSVLQLDIKATGLAVP